MELIWNKTPTGRRFIHTAPIAGVFQFCITQFEDTYRLRVQPETIESETQSFDSLKQAKAAAQRMASNGTWSNLITLEQREAYYGSAPQPDVIRKAVEAAEEKLHGRPPEPLGNCRCVVLPATGAIVPVPVDQQNDIEPPLSNLEHPSWPDLGKPMLPVSLTAALQKMADIEALEDCKFCGFLTLIPCETPPADYCENAVHRQLLARRFDSARRMVAGGTFGKLGQIPADAPGMPLFNLANQRGPQKSFDEILADVQKSDAELLAMYPPILSLKDWAKRLTVTQYDLERYRAWAWPTRGAYVERDISVAREVANIKRTTAKQTGNARVLVSRNKREGKFAKPYWADHAYGCMRHGGLAVQYTGQSLPDRVDSPGILINATGEPV